jgi:hypoxanthine phosphoribosyltransferase
LDSNWHTRAAAFRIEPFVVDANRPGRISEEPVKQLLSEAELREGVARLAREITRDYEGRPITIVGILTGSLVLLADLIRQLDMPIRIGLVQANSYRGPKTTPGELSIKFDMLSNIEGREVLLVDDIFDTGHTLERVTSQLSEKQPASIRSVVLLRKADRCEVSLSPDYVGFDIPDVFVVGYGLDYNDQYRNLPHVATLDPADLAAVEQDSS